MSSIGSTITTTKLKVSVIAGRSLAGQTNSNIYCEVMVLDKKGEKLGRNKNSRVVRFSSTPKWDERLEFDASANEFSGLFIRCWDKHTFRRDRFMGQVTIKLNPEVLRGEALIDDWFPLSQRGGKKKEEVSGDLQLRIQYGELVEKKKDTTKKSGSYRT